MHSRAKLHFLVLQEQNLIIIGFCKNVYLPSWRKHIPTNAHLVMFYFKISKSRFKISIPAPLAKAGSMCYAVCMHL